MRIYSINMFLLIIEKLLVSQVKKWRYYKAEENPDRYKRDLLLRDGEELTSSIKEKNNYLIEIINIFKEQQLTADLPLKEKLLFNGIIYCDRLTNNFNIWINSPFTSHGIPSWVQQIIRKKFTLWNFGIITMTNMKVIIYLAKR